MANNLIQEFLRSDACTLARERLRVSHLQWKLEEFLDWTLNPPTELQCEAYQPSLISQTDTAEAMAQTNFRRLEYHNYKRR